MIITRMLRAVPYVLGAAALGLIVGIVFMLPPLLTASVTAAGTAILIGRDIWRERHTWDELERKYTENGLNIHDQL